MKTIGILLAVITIFSFLLATESFAQQGVKWKGSGGWGMGTPYSRMYDPKTVETLTGEVVSLNLITPTKGMSSGVQLVLRTSRATISVHLGPEWYIENQDVKITPKDKVDVKGSRITFEGKPVIIASEVKKGNQVLKLRDENGFPAWSGWRR